MAQIIAVTGATGKQGGGVVDALLSQGKFQVRAISRDPSSDKAKALAQRGVEVVQADLNDKVSLVKAFEGAHGVFLITDAYSAGRHADTEFAHGKHAIDAAKEVGVEHLVWSGLEDPRKTEGVYDKLKEVAPGRLVPHFESKAAVTEYLKASGVPATVLLTSIFYDNFSTITPYIPQDDESHSYAFFLNVGTEKGYAASDVADIGATAAVALADPNKYIGETLVVVGELLNYGNAAAIISKVTGKTVKYVNIPDEKLAAAFPDTRMQGNAVVKGKRFEQWAQDHKEELAAKFN